MTVEQLANATLIVGIIFFFAIAILAIEVRFLKADVSKLQARLDDHVYPTGGKDRHVQRFDIRHVQERTDRQIQANDNALRDLNDSINKLREELSDD